MELWLNYAAIYVAVTYVFLLLRPSPRVKDIWFAFSGLALTYFCFFNTGKNAQVAGFVLCVVLMLWFYMVLVLYRDFSNSFMGFAAMGGPLILLAAVKLGHINFIAGFSYLTFRVAYLAYELHTGRVGFPSLARYMGFMFFPLTFLIGPISPYRFYEESIEHAGRRRTPVSRCLGRILVGILKCYIFAQLFKSVSFYNYWLPNYEHGFQDFTISCIATACFIYFNFSGACDMLIGASALMGIHVQENFNNPFLSRNLAEYWTRNHITLTQVVRDLIFTPSTLFLARLSGGQGMLFITSLLTLLTFFIVGVWHGTSLGFVLFGIMHGIGVIVVNLYGVLLRHMPARVQHWATTRPARLVSTFITFMYVSYSSVFFGNDAAMLQDIWMKLAI